MNKNFYDEMLNIINDYFVKRSFKTCLQSSPLFYLLLKNIKFFQGITNIEGNKLYLDDIYTTKLLKEDYEILDDMSFNSLIKKEQSRCYSQVKQFSKIFIKSILDEVYYTAFPKNINNFDKYSYEPIFIDYELTVPNVMNAAKKFEEINDIYPSYLFLGTNFFNLFINSLPSRDNRSYNPDIKNIGFDSIYHDILLILHEPLCPNNIGYFIIPEKIFLATTESVKSYSDRFSPFFASFSTDKIAIRFGAQIISHARYSVQKVVLNC
ncbi:hypothetical protein Thena_0942 [Thermodesulfobium narugense DSM 14796]|uniref:Uncharacterized protein n=1 Tax=Thermodesulfobium narugense DSM 14796 TaxID=747365 RepID=M1E5Z5_9BACT|nr:hypothetical protein [Thermodesulfobium narugense]AEE14571.1 hypothetical protein Thena_0942 [Thermodesulfobium narugense DSM 14796]